MLAFLSVTYLLEQGTRQVYNATLPQIRLDFLQQGVTDAQLGMVGTVFGAVFGLSILFSGFAADFLGRKRVVVIGTLLFSLGVLMTGFSSGLWALIAFYGVMNAIGQCCVAPPCFSMICQHFEKNRCMAMGIFSSCNYLGVIVCSVLSGVIGGLGSGVWRWAFWGFGAFGVMWAFGLQKVLVDDNGARRVAQAGRARCPQRAERRLKNMPPYQNDSANMDRPKFRDAFVAFVGKPTAVLLVLAFGMLIYANLGIYLWTPTFLMRTFDSLTLAEAAFHAVFWSSVGSMSGLFITARVTDRLVAHCPTARFDMTIVGMALCALTVLGLAAAPTLASCCLGLFAFGFARGVLECTVYPAMFDVIVPQFRAACTGMAGCWAFLFGSLAPFALGWLGERFSLRTGIATLTVFEVVGVVLLLVARVKFLRNDMDCVKTYGMVMD